MDPFSDLISLLRPRATLWGRIQGTGRWALSFRKRDDLLFCWVEAGALQLTRPNADSCLLQTGDFALIRTSTPFTLTTDPALDPQDSEDAVAATGSTELVLGEATGARVVLRCGRFVFDTANESLLWSLLPSLLHVKAGRQTSWRIRSLLTLNDAESQSPGLGSDLLVSRLIELTLLEVLRSEVPRLDPNTKGLLAGLADPMLSQALIAMHQQASRTWTVAALARLCGVSRSSFATRFQDVMGVGPIEYLTGWRIAIAKDKLRYGTQTIGEIALVVGFQSSSAFSTAFSRVAGCSPKQFAQGSGKARSAKSPKAAAPAPRAARARTESLLQTG